MTILSEQLEIGEISDWGQYERCRYPTAATGWNEFGGPCPVFATKLSGTMNYDLLLNPMARMHPISSFRLLLSNFREDFVRASYAFSPLEWRLLYYLPDCNLGQLTQPGFDAKQALNDSFVKSESVLFMVPTEWIGAEDPCEIVAFRMRENLDGVSADTAKAIWALVAYAKAMRLEKHEVYRLPWWDLNWLHQFNRHAAPA